MNTVTERIRRAREERRIAETEKDYFPNPAANAGSKEAKSSLSSSGNPKSSRDKASTDAYPKKRKGNNAGEDLAVNYISDNVMLREKTLGYLVQVTKIVAFLLLYNKD